ncbi:MAG: TorF family putative porin, partial [Desulfuromonadales bacterium]|nr:TorF family putative porin [Desulfuromonadales bacterium]
MQVVRKIAVLMAFAVVSVVCVTSVATAEVEVEGGAYVGVFDKYLWRGFDLSGSEPVVQGGVDLTAGAFTLSYWSNLQLSSNDDEGYVAGEMNETDLILDYSFDVNDLVSMSIGDMLYAVDGLEDTHEAYVGVYLALPLEPSLTVYWDWDEAEEAGLYYVLSVAHAFELSETLSLNLSAS